MPRRALRSSPTTDATDLTDAQWAAIAPLVATPSPNGDRPTDIDRRAIVNALRSKHRTGCQWRMRPNDVPPMRSVRSSFDPWNRDGTCIKINDTLRHLVHLQETFSDVVKTDKTGLSKTAHTRWMISAFANFLPGSTIFRLA